MKPSHRLVLLATALSAAAAAHAQLKPPARSDVTPKSALPAAPAAPAAAAATASPDADKESAGKLAAHAWLLLLDRKDWGTAWDSSAAMFRQSVPLPSWMDAIPKVREPFGALVTREPAEAVYKTTMPGKPAGDYVSVLFVSKFGKKPQVQEVVTTVREPDGRWRVAGYTYNER
jgi:hypothetical protein